jgi:WD40 repeat protein
MTPTRPTLIEPNNLGVKGMRVFGDARFHTDGDLLAVAFAADGSLWSIEEPGLLRHWNETGQEQIHHSLSDLETLWTFSRDARLLASASDDWSLWDVANGQLLNTVAQPSWVTALAFRDDSRLVATGHDNGQVCLWEVAGQRFIRQFKALGFPISALAFSREGTRLAFAGEDRVVYLWDIETGRAIGSLEGHTDRIQALAWHPKGHQLVSAGWDTTARIWDSATCETLFILNNHTSQVTALAYSPDGRLLASADSEDSIHIWDFTVDRLRHRFAGHRSTILCLAFAPDGNRLASGGEDRVIRLWDLRQNQDVAQAARLREDDSRGLQPCRSNLALSPDGSRLVSSQGPLVQIFDTTSGERLWQQEEGTVVQGLAYSSDGRWIAAGGSDARIRLCDTGSGRVHAILEDEDQREPITSLVFSPDSTTLASASATFLEVWLWNVGLGEPELLIPDASAGCAIEALAFHPQGRLLATGGIDWLSTSGSDGTIAIWDLVERCEVTSFDGGTKAMAFHPKGRWLASASLSRSICIWDLETGQLVEELIGHEDTVNCVAYSSDGLWLASGGDDRALYLWDVATGTLLTTVDLSTQIKALAFSPDGRFLYTGNGNLTCYQLDVNRLLALE